MTPDEEHGLNSTRGCIHNARLHVSMEFNINDNIKILNLEYPVAL